MDETNTHIRAFILLSETSSSITFIQINQDSLSHKSPYQLDQHEALIYSHLRQEAESLQPHPQQPCLAADPARPSVPIRLDLALFSARLYKIVKTVQRASRSNGAVEGILAAGVAYTLISMLMKFALKSGGPKILRWLFILFDLLFVIAFSVVAGLTRPNGGTSGPCHYYRGRRIEPNGTNCNLPWGTFILAIVST